MLSFIKRIAFVSICFFIVSPAFAQSTTTKKTSAPKSAGLSPEKSQMLCKAWRLDSISEYGVDNKASGKQINDGITFVADGSFFITLDGVSSTGTWTYTGGRINAAIKNPDNNYSFKIVGLSDKCLILDFQYPAPDLSRAKFTYSPKK
jgi:hypothetical protein